MTWLLDQLSRLFVEPPAPAPAPEEREVRWLPPRSVAPDAVGPRPARRVAVVCAAREARLAGGAAALALAHVAAAPSVVVLEWMGEDAPPARDRPASPASRREAARVRDAGCETTSSGRLVRVALPGGEQEAYCAARAALPRIQGPSVVVVAGARGAGIERILAEQERILLVLRPDADAELAAIALAALESLAPSRTVELARSPGAAALARSGTALVAPLRAPFRAALEGGG